MGSLLLLSVLLYFERRQNHVFLFSVDAIKSDSSDEDEEDDKKEEKVDIDWPSSNDLNKEDDRMDIDNDSNDSNKGT